MLRFHIGTSHSATGTTYQATGTTYQDEFPRIEWPYRLDVLRPPEIRNMQLDEHNIPVVPVAPSPPAHVFSTQHQCDIQWHISTRQTSLHMSTWMRGRMMSHDLSPWSKSSTNSSTWTNSNSTVKWQHHNSYEPPVSFLLTSCPSSAFYLAVVVVQQLQVFVAICGCSSQSHVERTQSTDISNHIEIKWTG